MEKFCDLVGMNKEKLLLTWEASPTPEKFKSNERFKRFLQTFQESTGIERGKSSTGTTLEDREVEWQKEFGRERAKILARRVEESWEDYQFLKGMRL